MDWSIVNVNGEDIELDLESGSFEAVAADIGTEGSDDGEDHEVGKFESEDLESIKIEAGSEDGRKEIEVEGSVDNEDVESEKLEEGTKEDEGQSEGLESEEGTKENEGLVQFAEAGVDGRGHISVTFQTSNLPQTEGIESEKLEEGIREDEGQNEGLESEEGTKENKDLVQFAETGVDGRGHISVTFQTSNLPQTVVNTAAPPTRGNGTEDGRGNGTALEDERGNSTALEDGRGTSQTAQTVSAARKLWIQLLRIAQGILIAVVGGYILATSSRLRNIVEGVLVAFVGCSAILLNLRCIKEVLTSVWHLLFGESSRNEQIPAAPAAASYRCPIETHTRPYATFRQLVSHAEIDHNEYSYCNECETLFGRGDEGADHTHATGHVTIFCIRREGQPRTSE